MTVFVAGGSGTIGVPLVKALASAGHRVVATTRSNDKQASLRKLGAIPVVVDALDADALERAVRDASPSHVIHQLTALPKAGVRRPRDLAATNRLREEGTRNLLRAAIAARAERLIVGSFAPLGSLIDSAPSDAGQDPAARAVRVMETEVLEASRQGAIEGIILRYGLFYGPGTPSADDLIAQVRRRRLPRVRNDRGQLPFIHIDDAVAATVAALDRGAPGSVLDIVDDHPASFSEMVVELAKLSGAPEPFAVPSWLPRLVAPYMAKMLALRVSLSNAPARAALGWSPAFPSYRDGLRQMLERAA